MSRPLPLVGETVYLRGRLGDRDLEAGKSVTVVDGTPATVTRIIGEGGYLYVLLDIPTSPGQKKLRTERGDFWNVWSQTQPGSTAWDHLLASDPV